MTSTLWIILIIALAVVLDAYFILVWRRYRHLLQSRTKQSEDKHKLRYKVWLQAIKISEFQELKKEFSSWKIERSKLADTPSADEPRTLTFGGFKIFILFLGTTLIARSLWFQGQEWSKMWQWKTGGLLLVGLAITIGGQFIPAEKKLPSWTKWVNKTPNWARMTNWQIICLVLSIPATVFASSAAGYEAQMKHGELAVALWLLSIGLAISGGWKSPPPKKISKQTVISFGALILAAFVIRIVNLNHIPIILSGDEASGGLSAINFINGHTNNIFSLGWFSFPSFYFYLQSLSISIFGQTTWALRITSTIAGALTVGAVYLLSKAMFGERAALFSSIFLATLHYHNNFSRLGLNNVWDGLWFVVVLGLVWYGWEKEHRAAFLFAGFFLGFSQYFYVSVRALFGLIPAWVFLIGVFNKPKLKRNIPNLLLMALVTFVTFFPLAHFFAKHPNDFLAPMHRVSVIGDWLNNEIQLTGDPAWKIVLTQLKLSFLGYTHLPLRHWYKPETPILRLLPATLFFLGIAALTKRTRQTSTYILLMWLIIVGLMGGLSVEAPAAQRYMALAPALAMTVGLGLSALSAELAKAWESRANLINVLAILAIAVISADELRFYFLDYTPKSDFGGANGMVAQRLADYLQDKPNDYQVFFFGQPRMGYDSIRSLPYLAPHVTGITCNTSWASTETPRPTSEHFAFVLLPENLSELESIQVDYPSGKLLVERTHGENILYLLYEISLESEEF